MTGRNTAIRAMQPWYSLGLVLLVAGLMTNIVAGHWRIGAFAAGDFFGGAMLGCAIVFLLYALVKRRKWTSGGRGA